MAIFTNKRDGKRSNAHRPDVGHVPRISRIQF